MARGHRGRLAAGVLTLAGVVLALVPPAGAIQTTTWGIQPASKGSTPRASFQYPSNGQTIHDAVVVYNRTATDENITLAVVSAAGSSGSYQYSTVRKGLASGIEMPVQEVHLGPHQQANVPFTLKLPHHSKVTTVAAVAAEGAPEKQGSLLIQQQLVILVKATPSTVSSPIVRDVGIWGPIAGGLLAVVAGWLALVVRRRRRSASGRVAAAANAPVDQAAVDMAGVR
jgi:hypothetical protein